MNNYSLRKADRHVSLPDSLRKNASNKSKFIKIRGEAGILNNYRRRYNKDTQKKLKDNAAQKGPRDSIRLPLTNQESTGSRRALTMQSKDPVTSQGVISQGIAKTIARSAKIYYWPRMFADIAKYVRKYTNCLAHKASQERPAGVRHRLKLHGSKISSVLYRAPPTSIPS